jgi:hypothetical protein
MDSARFGFWAHKSVTSRLERRFSISLDGGDLRPALGSSILQAFSPISLLWKVWELRYFLMEK